MAVVDLFAFAHRRLAIIDLDPRSNQPFLDEELGLTVTYKREIYNYRDLRRTLLRREYRFCTESDSEVVCEAFSCWRIDSVKRLREWLLSQSKIKRRGQRSCVFASQPSAILQRLTNWLT
ncbi:hypothetical protein [Bradyrhizobium vignae]|uniref:hypothetical protein n=1 Tax=Bradyrhizobium vignae TaxID=1549949 RepID=UPI0013E8F159